MASKVKPWQEKKPRNWEAKRMIESGGRSSTFRDRRQRRAKEKEKFLEAE